MNNQIKIQGDLCHDILIRETKPKLSFNDGCEYQAWRLEVKEKLVELLGISEIEKNRCEPNFRIESDVQKDGYRQVRFVFESEVGAFVPCYLLIPNTNKEKYPVAITLQGHSTGFHNSIAEPKDDEDAEYAVGRGAFAVQAVKNGYAALAIEQRAMGERVTARHEFTPWMCTFATMAAFQLGRTTLGERVWDIQRAIDLLPQFTMLDTEKIIMTGNSGGGTATFYASCLDERVKISAPSCAFCSYKNSILDIRHCPCNYIPNSYKWFEMQDLVCLIAPRTLLVIAGKEDKIFPIDGVRNGYKIVEKIYKKSGESGKCKLVETPKGHWWCEDIVWGAINEEVKSHGW